MPDPVPAVTRDQLEAEGIDWTHAYLTAQKRFEDVCMAVWAKVTEGGSLAEVVDLVGDWMDECIDDESLAAFHRAKDAAKAPQPKVLTEAEATWHKLADESPTGEPARWSHAVNAIVADSGKWDRWPEFSGHGWWNARVAQSAIENLYRYGFAVVAVDPKAIERIEADADRVVALGPPVPEAPEGGSDAG